MPSTTTAGPAREAAAPSSRNGNALLRSGIGPLDDRLGGLRPGGTYLLAGLPGSGRFVALLQFLAAGIEEGRVGLVTAAPRSRVFEEARHWGFDLEGAWKAGRLGLLSYKPDFQRHLLSAAEPRSVFDEMGRLLGSGVKRLALYPATPLWETRAGTAMASHVIDWLDSYGATTLGAVGGDLETDRTPASDWVLDAATGVFLMDRDPSGLRQLWVRRLTPPLDEAGPITLELANGKGYIAPSGGFERRRGDRAAGSRGKVLMIRLADAVPEGLGGWLDRWYRTTSVGEPFEAVERVQKDGYGLVLIYLSRERIDEALQAIRAIRGLDSVPVILATDQKVRAEDRIRALEAGASDFLSDPLSIGELASRAEKAMISGAPPLQEETEDMRSDADATVAAPAAFSEQVEDRLGSPRGSLFAFLRIPLEDGFEGRARLTDTLADEIRDEQGDLVGDIPGGIGVLLHGAETTQATAFLERVRRRLGAEVSRFDAEVLSGTTDREEVRTAVAGARK